MAQTAPPSTRSGLVIRRTAKRSFRRWNNRTVRACISVLSPLRTSASSTEIAPVPLALTSAWKLSQTKRPLYPSCLVKKA